MWNENGTFTFSFDLSMAEALRGAVNEKVKASFDKEHKIEKKKTLYLAWLRICACMDRIYDTLQHINSMQIKRNENEGAAFDFLDFLNHSCVVVDCIKRAGEIFEVDQSEIEKIENTQDVFGDVLNAGGTDSQFFRYIRSLCVTHPVDTYYSTHPYLFNAAVHCSPFVRWNHGLNNSGDLYVHVYSIMPHQTVTTTERDNENNIFQIPLYMNQFEEYLRKWVNFLAVVIEAIKNYNDAVYDRYREMPLKVQETFATYGEYLEYLKQESQKRFGSHHGFLFDEYARFLSCGISDDRNKYKAQKYQNAIRYAISFVHSELQDMTFEGFEHTGIKEDNFTETSLFLELYMPSDRGSEFNKYHYNFSKVYQLIDGDFYERRMARVLLEKVKPLINRYVYFSNQESDVETVLLVNVALYLNALEQNCVLNRNIPNELRFRERLLSEEEIALFQESEKEVLEEPIKDVVIRFVDENGNEIDSSEMERYSS